jgi:hypothetical protein
LADAVIIRLRRVSGYQREIILMKVPDYGCRMKNISRGNYLKRLRREKYNGIIR